MKKKNKKYFQVRVENHASACGYVGHMTAEEMKACAANESVELSCPVCGLVHLSQEEIKEIEAQKIVETPRYNKLLEDACERD